MKYNSNHSSLRQYIGMIILTLLLILPSRKLPAYALNWSLYIPESWLDLLEKITVFCPCLDSKPWPSIPCPSTLVIRKSLVIARYFLCYLGYSEEHGRMCCKQALWLRLGSFVSNVFAYNWMIFKVCNWVDLERKAASSFLLSLFRSLLLLWILCTEGRIWDCCTNDLKMPFNINPPICISESTLLLLYLKKLGNEIKVSLQL